MGGMARKLMGDVGASKEADRRAAKAGQEGGISGCHPLGFWIWHVRRVPEGGTTDHQLPLQSPTPAQSANKQLEDAATALLSEKERMEALLRRQYNLIECLGLDPEASLNDSGPGPGPAANGTAVAVGGAATMETSGVHHTSPAGERERTLRGRGGGE
jgi:hypothetical protein